VWGPVAQTQSRLCHAWNILCAGFIALHLQGIELEFGALSVPTPCTGCRRFFPVPFQSILAPELLLSCKQTHFNFADLSKFDMVFHTSFMLYILVKDRCNYKKYSGIIYAVLYDCISLSLLWPYFVCWWSFLLTVSFPKCSIVCGTKIKLESGLPLCVRPSQLVPRHTSHVAGCWASAKAGCAEAVFMSGTFVHSRTSLPISVVVVVVVVWEGGFLHTSEHLRAEGGMLCCVVRKRVYGTPNSNWTRFFHVLKSRACNSWRYSDNSSSSSASVDCVVCHNLVTSVVPEIPPKFSRKLPEVFCTGL
jgi:hypothetical protein